MTSPPSAVLLSPVRELSGVRVDGTCPCSGLGAPRSPAEDREGKAKSIGHPRQQDGWKQTEVQARVPDTKSQVQSSGSLQ